MNDRAFHCLVCRGDQAGPHYLDCRDYYVGKRYRVDYYRCLKCGLVQQFPVPRDVSAFYDEYPIHASESRLRKLFRKTRYAHYWNPDSALPGTVLLDYGCGDGSYLSAQRDKGLSLIGYEPAASLANQLGKRLELPVYGGDINALLRAHAGSIDVLTMHFVLEHLTDLHEGFTQARQLLKTGGTFYFLVPQIDSLEARVFGRRWHNLDAPRHISFPGPIAVQRLADEHGFVITHHKAAAFANGIAGSIPVLLAGRFSYPLFLLVYPLGMILSRLRPDGCRAFNLSKL